MPLGAASSLPRRGSPNAALPLGILIPIAECGLLVPTMSAPSVPCPPAGVVDCDPDVQAATSTVYYLRNKKKNRNFIMDVVFLP